MRLRTLGRLCDPASWLPLAAGASSQNLASVFLLMHIQVSHNLSTIPSDQWSRLRIVHSPLDSSYQISCPALNRCTYPPTYHACRLSHSYHVNVIFWGCHDIFGAFLCIPVRGYVHLMHNIFAVLQRTFVKSVKYKAPIQRVVYLPPWPRSSFSWQWNKSFNLV